MVYGRLKKKRGEEVKIISKKICVRSDKTIYLECATAYRLQEAFPVDFLATCIMMSFDRMFECKPNQWIRQLLYEYGGGDVS
jgi:hypothetical protein